MTIEIVVPESGESVVEATVARWLKDEGDQVATGEPVVELETDKVNLEVAAERGGTLARIDRQAGEDVKVGDVLGIIEEEEEAAATAESPPADKKEAKKETKEKVRADKKEEKAAKEKERQEEKKKKKEKQKKEVEEEREEAAAGEEQPVEEKATPVARRLAQEQDVDLAEVSSSDGQRISRADIERYLEKESKETPAEREKAEKVKEAKPEKEEKAEPAAKASAEAGRPESRERMSRRRQTIARRLVEAQQTAAMSTTFNEIDMSAVIDLRQRRQESFTERHEVKLGFMSFFVKASIGALKAFPTLNAEIDGDEIVYKHYYDVGIAVGAPQGLVVPVVRNVESKTFAEIEKEIKALAEKALDNSLTLPELRGGTFTITNGGVFGSLLSAPIFNPPQVGILGLHKIEKRPVVVEEEIVIRPMMYVALSYDHRIVDGREAVQFLVRLKELVEYPERLLLEG